MSVRERFDAGEWIEEAAAGLARAVRPEDLDVLLRTLREFGIVLPFARMIVVDPNEPSSEKLTEAITRTSLVRAATFQELDAALFALLNADLQVLLHGTAAAYLAVDDSDLEVSDCEIWVRDAEQVDALRVLGKAGFRALEPYAGQLRLGDETVLQSSAGSPHLKVRRVGREDGAALILEESWTHAASGGLRNLPRQVLRPSATDLVFSLMRDFSNLESHSLRLLLVTRSVLRSPLRKEIDWIRLAKSLAQVGSLGRAIAGFFILSQQWDVPLEGPIQGLVEARRRGLSGELLRSWFSPRELLRPQVPQVRRILGRLTALR
jgi:hypothetical protein